MRAYLPLFRLPGAPAFCLAALLGRMPISMLGIGSVLLVQDRRGSYALAGLVAAAYALGQAGGAPALSRLVDRRGQAVVLLPGLVVCAAALVGVVVTAGLTVPAALVVACAALAGAALPPLGACVRARWASALRAADREPLLDTAFAVESVLDEVVFVAGPAVVVALAVAVDPGVALLTAAALMAGGTAWFALQRGTEPPVAAAPSSAGRARAGRGGAGPGTAPRTAAGSALRVPGLRTVVAAMVAVGTLFGALEVAMVAFAGEQGRPSAAGVLLPLVAVASGAAGLVYGARAWRTPVAQRFLLALLGLAVGTPPLLVAPGVATMAVAALVAGVAVSPSLIASFGLAERLVPPGARTEGFTWLNTGLNVGAAVGAAATGALVDGPGSRAGFGVCVGGAVVALLVAVAGRRTLTPDAPPSSARADVPDGVSPSLPVDQQGR